MNTHDIELPQGYRDRPWDYDGDLYTEGQVRAAIEADRQRRGEQVGCIAAARTVGELAAIIPVSDIPAATATCQDMIDYFKRLIADHKRSGEPSKCPECSDPDLSPEKHWQDGYDDGVAAALRRGEPVAYLDLGVGGYMDVGTDLTDEQLAALPKGRHMLGIIGTYGVDGYAPAEPDEERLAMEAVMESVDPATWPRLTPAQRCALGRFAKPQPAEPMKGQTGKTVLRSQDRVDAELVEILREAAEIIAAVPTDYAPENLRRPIVDELEGFALMLDQARRIEGRGK